MNRFMALGAAICALLAGCAVAGGVYRSGCYEVVWGDFDIDPESGDYRFGGSGLCIRRLNEACEPLKDFKFEMGLDENGDGIIQDNERMGPSVNDPNPTGSLVCAGGGSGSVGTGKRGKRILINYEAKKGDEPTPFISTTESLTVK